MVATNLRIPDDLHAALVQAARADGRSLNSLIVRILTAAMTGQGGPPEIAPDRLAAVRDAIRAGKEGCGG